MPAPRWGIFGIDTGRAVWCSGGRRQFQFPDMARDGKGVCCPECNRYMTPIKGTAIWTEPSPGHPSVIRLCRIPQHKRLPPRDNA